MNEVTYPRKFEASGNLDTPRAVLLRPSNGKKPVPVIVTESEPMVEPVSGEIELMTGSAK